MDVGQGVASVFDRHCIRDAHFFRGAVVQNGPLAILDDLGFLPRVLLRVLCNREVCRFRLPVFRVVLFLPLPVEKTAIKVDSRHRSAPGY